MNIKKITAVLAMSTALTTTPVMAETLLEKVTSFLPTWFKLDSGRNDIDKSKIEKFVTPAQDLNDLLRPMANVQFDKSVLKRTTNQTKHRDSVLDQRPQGISISGGRTYENLFVIDGANASSRLAPDVGEDTLPEDTVNTQLGVYNNFHRGSNKYNRSAQSQWVKPFDVEKVKVYDSNVPAKYGKFVGGVIDVTTKKPTGKRGGTVYYDFSNSSMESLVNVDGGVKPTYPRDWSRYNAGFRVNSNEHEVKGNSFILSASANQSHSKTVEVPFSTAEVKIAGQRKHAKSATKDFGVSANIKMKDNTKVDVALNQQKYEIDNKNLIGIDTVAEQSTRNGDNASISVSKPLSSGRNVTVSLRYNDNKLGKHSFGKNESYAWSKTESFIPEGFKANCGSATYNADSCTTGGFGTYTEWEKSGTLGVNYSFPTKFGNLETGLDMQHADLRFKRHSDYKYHSNASLYPGSTCSWSTSGSMTVAPTFGWGWGGPTPSEKKLNCIKGQTDLVFSNHEKTKSSSGDKTWTMPIGDKVYDINKKLLANLKTAMDSTTRGKTDKLVYRGSKVDCSKESITCKDGKYVLYHRDVFKKMDKSFSGLERGGYMQLTNKIDGFDLRYGVRYDYDTLLNNATFAPRFSASKPVEMFGGKYQTTWGINRYYANSNATYHLLSSEMRKSQTQIRVPKCSDASCTKTIWTDKWVDYNDPSSGLDYKYTGLKTPYSDELSMAMNTPVYYYGQFRFKLLKRFGKDEFADGGSRNLTNEGKSEYGSFSVEYKNQWNDRYWGGGNNSFFANTTFSKSESSNDHLAQKTLERTNTTNVYYGGKVVKEAVVLQEAKKRQSPASFNFGYSRQSQIKYGDLSATFTGRFTLPHYTLGKTYFDAGGLGDKVNADGESLPYAQGSADGSTGYTWLQASQANALWRAGYYKYSEVKTPASFNLDANFTLNVVRGGQPTGLQAYVGVHNILNIWNKGPQNGKADPKTFRGRLYTLGLTYKF